MNSRTLLALALCVAPSLPAQTLRTPIPDTPLFTYKSVGAAFSLELIQLMPDSVRAMYMAKNLPAEVVENIAGYCVFGSVARNESPRPLTYRVADWRAIGADGKVHRLKTKLDWLRDWRRHDVDFGWSILPAAQSFEPGDWGQGFTTIKLPRGARFDLDFTWRQDGKTHTATLDGVECTNDDVTNNDVTNNDVAIR
jgi:hypothetical protein